LATPLILKDPVNNDVKSVSADQRIGARKHSPVVCMFSSLIWILQLALGGRVVWHQGIMGVLMTPRGLLLTVSLASLKRSKVMESADA